MNASAARHWVSVTSRPSHLVASHSLATCAVRPATIDYRNTGIDVRDDIVASQTRAWQSLAAPGTWWTGAERVAIAREVRAARHCALCAERKAALSPYAVSGTHDAATDLRPTIVDAVHRVVTDPGRLSRQWADEVMAADVSDAHLVELVGVVCTVMLIDGFARTIGADPPPLPGPVAGDPSRLRPSEAVDEGYFVPTIPYAVGQGPHARALCAVPAGRDRLRAARSPDQPQPDGTGRRTHFRPERLLLLNDLARNGAPCEQQEGRRQRRHHRHHARGGE